jgi:signal transduction histidine kinase
LAQLEYELANYKNALSYLRTGIEILDDYPVDINLIQFYIIAGDCAYQLKEFDLSLGYYNKANINIDKNTLPLQYAHLTHGLAKLFKSTKSNIALNYANTSMEFAQLHQVKDLIIDNYSLQSEIYENLGNKTKALQLLKLHQSYKDSLRLNEINKNIAVLESNYELIKSKSYIEKLQLINEKNILKNLIYLIFVIITIFTSILLFFLLKNRNQINRELKRANLVKDKLLSIISHDLKSPLNNIVTVLDGIAKDDYSKDELELIINSLNNQTLATVDTLDNILQWGKTQLRGIVVNKTILDADSQIQDNIKIHNAQLINKGLTIQYSGINDLKIMFDKDHFDFIIRNFISNAIKFSYENSIVEINIESDEQLDFITISVIDHGVGLQLSEIDTIFSSVPSIKTGTSNEKGTGLALSLSREFAELNGAKIGYSPNPPRGSVFFIKIQNIK